MAKLTITTFVTLDGVMQGPGAPQEDPIGFPHGGWLVPYADAGMGAFMTEVFDRADAFLLGRTTYQIFAGHWPRVTDPADPIASRLNGLPKHVASRTLDKVEWHARTRQHANDRHGGRDQHVPACGSPFVRFVRARRMNGTAPGSIGDRLPIPRFAGSKRWFTGPYASLRSHEP